MLIIGLDAFGDDTAPFDLIVSSSEITSVEISDMIIDEVYMERGTTNFNITRQEWNNNTILLGKFQGTLEAGNITNAGVPIERVVFRRRFSDELTWTNIATFNYSSTQLLYEFIDNIVQATAEYEYTIAPLTSGTLGANIITASITCDFNSTFISDRTNSYQLIYNLEYSDINYNVPSTVFEPFTKYPFVVYAGETDYRTGQIQVQILSDSSISNPGTLDARAERINRDGYVAFINNKRPKILKDHGGRFYLVTLTNIFESPDNQFNQTKSNVTFTWTEIGNAFDQNDLVNNGLIEIEGIS